jgi:outer membrane protein assembly factor BamB
MRRVLIVLAGIAVLVGGALAAVVIHRLHEGRDVLGSSTEFTVPTRREKPPPLRVPWPTYGYDATRTRAVGLALRPPFRRLWTYHAGSLVEFPPAIGYGRLYFSTNAGRFTAASEKTGKQAWAYRSHRCVAATPAIGTQQHGTVYAVFLNRPPCNRSPGGAGMDGKVIAFAAGFGRIRWQKTIGPSETSPLLLGNRLYVGDWNGDVWALDARTGRVIWRFHTHGPVKGSVASSGRRLYVGSYDGHLYCLTLGGRLVWRAAGQPRLYGGAQFYSTPAVAYGRVYIGSTDGKVYSFGATSGRLRWSHSTGGYVYSSPAVWNELVFVGSYSHRFYAFDAATGAVRWTFDANGPISGSPTVIGKIVYFATLARRTYALDARTGRQLWTFPDGKYTPVVAVRRRLFLVGLGKIYGLAPTRRAK